MTWEGSPRYPRPAADRLASVLPMSTAGECRPSGALPDNSKRP